MYSDDYRGKYMKWIYFDLEQIDNYKFMYELTVIGCSPYSHNLWVTESPLTPSEIGERLGLFLGENDELFISEINPDNMYTKGFFAKNN